MDSLLFFLFVVLFFALVTVVSYFSWSETKQVRSPGKKKPLAPMDTSSKGTIADRKPM